MAAPEDLRTGIRLVDSGARLLDRVTALMSVLGTLTILLVMLLISVDVVGRFFFGHPIAGVPEMVAMSILAIVFLQIANTLSRGKLTRSDALLGLMRSRNQRLGDGLDALMHAAGAFLVYVLVTAFHPLFLRSWGRNEMVGTVGQFMAPIWPVHLIVLVGSTMLLAVFLMRTLCLLIRAWNGPAADQDAGDEGAS